MNCKGDNLHFHLLDSEVCCLLFVADQLLYVDSSKVVSLLLAVEVLHLHWHLVLLLHLLRIVHRRIVRLPGILCCPDILFLPVAANVCRDRRQDRQSDLDLVELYQS